MPFEQPFILEDAVEFVRQASLAPTLESFFLTDLQQVEAFLQVDRPIKNVYFFFELDDEDAPAALKEHLYSHLLLAAGLSFQRSAVVLKKKLAEELARRLSKRFGRHVPVPEDSSLVAISCDAPSYLPLVSVAQQLPGLTFYQLLKFASNLPFFEMDRTVAGMAGKNEEKAVRIFAFATSILDYSETNRQIKQLQLALYCEFRDKIRFVWFDAFFNPARLQLLGIQPTMKYSSLTSFPLAAFVDFGSKEPRPFPQTLPFNKRSLQAFLRDALALDDRTFKFKYLVSEQQKSLERKKTLIRSFKGLQPFEDAEDLQAKTAVVVFLSQELTVNQISRILQHLAHAKRRVQVISQKLHATLAFLASVGEYPRQSLEIRQAGKPVQVAPLNPQTYSARWVLQQLAEKLPLPVDDYSHIPEEKIDLLYRDQSEVAEADYLYDDL